MELFAVWASAPTVTISYYIYDDRSSVTVTVGGQEVPSGWSGVIAPGTTIVAKGNGGRGTWRYNGTSFFGTGAAAYFTVPSGMSGTGTLYFHHTVGGDYHYFVTRGGVCGSWNFSVS